MPDLPGPDEALSIDFETRSTVDLRRTGVYPYAEHPYTEILCMAYAFPGEPARILSRDFFLDRPSPTEEREWARIKEEWVLAGKPLRAHNAQFERVVWRNFLHPKPSPDQWHCSAAEAAALALPRSLDGAAKAMGLDIEKDTEGRRLMLKMCKPRRPRKGEDPSGTYWHESQEDMARLGEYCLRDVEVERELSRRLRRLSPVERRVFLMDQAINDRGVGVDLELVRSAQVLVEEGMARANRELREITEGEVGKITEVAQLSAWIRSNGMPDLTDMQKATVRDALLEPGLDPVVERALTLRSEGAKSSTAKLVSLEEYASSNGRARGMLLYHGASTGRWSGMGPQPQNFPRGAVKATPALLDLIRDREYDLVEMETPALVAVSSCLRSMFWAEHGHRLMSADFGQIEARVVAWFAGQTELLTLFAGVGKVYEEMAAKIYRVPVDQIRNPSEERNIGKAAVLGCGFGMGSDTFATQVQKDTGIDLPRGARDEEGELLEGEVDFAQKVIDTYRDTNPLIRQFWWDIEAAAIKAVEEPGSWQEVGALGRVGFTCRADFLWARLPSGRYLAYARPRIQDRKTPWGAVKPALTYMGVNSLNKKWVRQHSYGGLLTENVVQATARDLMAYAIAREERAGYPVVLTVHDEILAEVPDGHGSLEEFLEIMAQLPRWAAGLPVKVEGWEGERYRK